MAGFRLLDRGDRPPEIADIVERFRETARRHRIRCPSCGWQPEPSSRWFCAEVGEPEHFGPGCGTRWHTFDTNGQCPGCHHQWRWTACLPCGAWARHEDWYVPEDDEAP